MKQSLVRLLRGCSVALLVALAAPATSLAIDEFPLPNPCAAAPPPETGTCQPGGITAGPDGALWFTEENGNRLGRINTAGRSPVHHSDLPAGTPSPWRSPPGRGGLWFTESGTSKIGAIHRRRAGQSFPCSSRSAASPDGIAAGPDGSLWFTEPLLHSRIGQPAHRDGSWQSIHSLLRGQRARRHHCWPRQPAVVHRGRGQRVRSDQSRCRGHRREPSSEYDLPNAGSDPSGITASRRGAVGARSSGQPDRRVSARPARSPSSRPAAGPLVRHRHRLRRRAVVHRDRRQQDRPDHCGSPAGSLTNEFVRADREQPARRISRPARTARCGSRSTSGTGSAGSRLHRPSSHRRLRRLRRHPRLPRRRSARCRSSRA